MSPVEFLVLVFPGERIRVDVVKALAEVRRDQGVRVIDSLLVTRSADGSVHTAELADLDYLEGIVAGTDETALIGAEDADEAAELLSPSETALLLLIEHTWLERAATSVRMAGGRIAASVHVPPEHVEQARLAATAKAG